MTIIKHFYVKKRSRMRLSEIDGDLLIGKGATIVAKKETITVNGRLKNKGGFKCIGNLHARSLTCEKGSVRILGSLSTNREIQVDRRLFIKENLIAEEVTVGLKLKVSKDCRVDKINAGGKVNLKGTNHIESINAGGKVKASGQNTIRNISAGRRISLLGSSEVDSLNAGAKIFFENGIIRKADAGLSILIKGKAEVSKANAGIKIKMIKECKLDKGNAGFKISSFSPLTFGTLNAGFKIKLREDSSGEKLQAGFSIKSKKDIDVKDSISVGYKCYAKSIISSKIFSGRKIIATKIEANRIEVAKKGKVRGIVIADLMILKERAKASNLYVGELLMHEYSKARNVFAERITLENNVIIKGQIMYTTELSTEPNAKIRSNPLKVEKLPIPEVKIRTSSRSNSKAFSS